MGVGEAAGTEEMEGAEEEEEDEDTGMREEAPAEGSTAPDA